MTSHIILNIGLHTPQAELTLPAVFKAMRAAGILWERHEHRESDTEPTLVVEVYASDHQIDLIATWLEQDCIAVWDMLHWEGRLVGPGRAKWGEFDPSQFILLNGSRLSEARSVAA
jgi:hypothetical protein